MGGSDNIYNSDKLFRQPQVLYITNLTSTFVAEHPFSTSCDTRGQLDALFKTINFQGKGILTTCNSFMELKYGNEFHKSCVDWVVNNSLTRPHLANMEIKDAKYFFIDGHNIYKFDENSYLAVSRPKQYVTH